MVRSYSPSRPGFRIPHPLRPSAARELPPIPETIVPQALRAFVQQALRDLYPGLRPITVLRDPIMVEAITRRVREMYWSRSSRPKSAPSFFGPIERR